jgi:hypothetical protein
MKKILYPHMKNPHLEAVVYNVNTAKIKGKKVLVPQIPMFNLKEKGGKKYLKIF